MNVVITAGGIPRPGQPLYLLTRGKPKAMLDIAGKPMIQHVLDAVSAAESVQRVVVVGLDTPGSLTCTKPLFFIPNQGNIFHNLRAGARKISEIAPQDSSLIAISSDLPALRGEMIDWVSALTVREPADVHYLVISRETMESRYPGSRRTYYWLKDIEICGADIHAFRIEIVARNEKLWRRLLEARKNAFHQALFIGLDTMLGFLTRRWTLDEVAERVCQRVNIRGRAVLCPYAEAGMDVDKPAQLDLVRRDFQQRRA